MEGIRRTHVYNVRTRLKTVEHWTVPAEVKADVARFIEELRLGKVNAGRRLSEARQVKCLNDLRRPLEFFAKPIPEITVADVEAFETALAANHLISGHTQRPYAETTKADLRQTVKIFLRWKLGAAEASRLAGWLDTRVPSKTPEYLSESEIERLFMNCRTPAQRFAIAVLFDSGGRAAEFLNIRFEDIQLPGPNEQFVRLTLKEEYSKTLGRTISLYWRHSLDAIQEFLKMRIAEGITAREPVFNGNYGALRMFVQRLGRRVLGKEIWLHLFRNSSATFYASKLNRQQLCYRYGWRYSSDMPDVYISRAGMDNKEADERIAHVELNDLRSELARKQQDDTIKNARIESLESEITDVKRGYRELIEVLKLNPRIEDVNAILKKRGAKTLSAERSSSNDRF